VPEFSAFDIEMVIDKATRHKSPDADQILAGLIKAGGRTIRSEIHHTLTNYIWNIEELPQQCKESISVPIHKQGDKTDRSNH
jgi:hypothetical protein